MYKYILNSNDIILRGVIQILDDNNYKSAAKFFSENVVSREKHEQLLLEKRNEKERLEEDFTLDERNELEKAIELFYTLLQIEK